MKSSPISAIALGIALITAPAAAFSATDREAGLELFEKHVRPTLVEVCVRCHGPKKQKGGLRLDSAEAWMLGGDSGPALSPGDPDASLLIKAIRYKDSNLKMPPKGILPAKTIQAFEKWAALGAPDPRQSTAPIQRSSAKKMTLEKGREFWSFKPIRKPAVPETRATDWPANDIDRFLFARMEKENLEPVVDAGKATLLRRVYYDLIGLPPTPAQIDAFLSDDSPEAWSRVVDSLLGSAQFGERWGRRWLDVVRFAESSGGGRTALFPDAWRYRDYVIETFNQDVPYNKFIREQIAGDLLTSDDWRERRRQLIGTAFLLLGPTNYELQDKEILEMDVVDEQLDTLGKAFLGMTIGCARCHDHKFDPIPAADYYAMAGIFKSTRAMIHSNVSTWNKTGLPMSPEEEPLVRERESLIARLTGDLDKAKSKLSAMGGKTKERAGSKSIDPASLGGVVVDDHDATLDGDWKESTSTSGYVGARYVHDMTEGKGLKAATFSPRLPAAGKYEIRVSYPAASNRATRVPVTIHHNGGETLRHVNQRTLAPIRGSLESLGVYELDPARTPRVIISNEGTENGVVIADAVVFIPSVETPEPTLAENAKPADKSKSKSSREKAAAIAGLKEDIQRLQRELKQAEDKGPKRPIAMSTIDEAEPQDIHIAIRGVAHSKGRLVKRGVMRAASYTDFPSIPETQSGRREFAEWLSSAENPLTARVMANRVWAWLFGEGLTRTVDNFGVMGQTPSHPELLDFLAASFIDDGWSVKQLINRIVMSRAYRLSSEDDAAATRIDPDNRLLWRSNRKRLEAEAIRDTLLFVAGNLELGIGGSNIKPGTKSEYGYTFESHRRSVYVPVFRNALPEIFETFDFADPNIQNGKRTASAVAPQALLLMNHPFVSEQAQSAAEALLDTENADTNDLLDRAYAQTLGRPPNSRERRIANAFLAAVPANAVRKDHEKRWMMLYQTLFQSLHFRYLN